MILDDVWWERVDLTIKIMDQPILADVYEGWDFMIESMDHCYGE